VLVTSDPPNVGVGGSSCERRRRPGAAIEATARLLESHGALPQAVVAATHGLLLEAARERLDSLRLARLLVTDTVPIPSNALPTSEVCSVAALLSGAIGCLHREEPIDDLARFE
jgi:ribose-phosphate pyrophosphokinase